ncbi:MAG TPA: zincin-like metallopeptidase domain-containing protein, partial [Geobacteraceae bacterium]|nr:zincin-like metallopeptidase domain-containing protein [Geobacteraceae bacterium]
MPWKKPWKAQPPRNLITNKPYHGVNFLLLGSQDYPSPYWLTFKQAQEKGGHVKKGEKGSMVTFWKIIEKDLKEENEEIEEGKELQFLLRYYTIFNLAQCEGIKSPPPEKMVDPIQKCEEIVGGYKDAPAVRFNNADKACYAPAGDYVSIQPRDTFESAEAYYASLFHELTHSTGHEKRLGRFNSHDVPRPFAGDEYSREELVAELGSAFLCAEAGIDNSQIENSAAYIQGWLKPLRNDKRLIVMASSQAARATRYILG